jgi:hypothetical protein
MVLFLGIFIYEQISRARAAVLRKHSVVELFEPDTEVTEKTNSSRLDI